MELPDPVLAHQGGWDEALVIAVPVAAFLLFRWFAARRQRRSEEDEQDPDHQRR